MELGGDHLRILLVALVCVPQWGESIMGGRDLKMNEFPYTVFMTKMAAGNNSESKCMGVIYGSLSIITAPMCFPNLDALDTTLMIVPAQFYIAGDIPKEQYYPINSVRYNGRAPMKSLINYAVVNINIPGIMLEPFEMENSSSVTMAAMFLNDKMKLANLVMKMTMGVVPGADKKAAGMKFLTNSDCELKFNALKVKDPKLADSVPNNNMVCAVKADKDVPHKSFGPIPPGYPCDSDAGAPLVVDGEVVAVLVKAYCEKDDEHFAMFETVLEVDDVDVLLNGLPSDKEGSGTHPPDMGPSMDGDDHRAPDGMVPGWRPNSGSRLNFNPKTWRILQAIILTFGIIL